MYVRMYMHSCCDMEELLCVQYGSAKNSPPIIDFVWGHTSVRLCRTLCMYYGEWAYCGTLPHTAPYLRPSKQRCTMGFSVQTLTYNEV